MYVGKKEKSQELKLNEHVEFEMALRLSGGDVEQVVGNTVWGLGRFEVEI